MRMLIVPVLLGAVSAMFTAIGGAQGMIINSPSDGRVGVLLAQKGSDVAKSRGFQEAEFPKHAVFVVNRSNKQITTLVVKWSTIVPGGATQVTWSRYDGYLYPPTKVIVPARSEALIGESGFTHAADYSALVSQPLQMGSPLTIDSSDDLLGSNPSGFTVDLVIFEDGEMLGDNSSHYEKVIAARHKAMVLVADQLSSATTEAGVEVSARVLIDSWKSNSDDPDDPYKISVAKTILHSPNRLGTISLFRRHEIPSSFYRANVARQMQ